MKDFEYHSPATLSEACSLLKKYNDSAYVLAGGTDLIPKMYQRRLAPEHVINIKNVPGLNEITFDDKQGLNLGALVKFNEIIYSEIVQDKFPILVEISKMIASHQLRNLATIGGNLCNAAPSADSAPALIALDSTVTITGPGGKKRTMTLEQFFTGPGVTALAPGELLTQITVPPMGPNTGIAYIKHKTRMALEIAVVGASGLLQLEKETEKCTSARVVIAACAPTPLRVSEAEKILTGRQLNESLLQSAAEAAAAAVEPITDVRACAEYRREMVQVQCRRVLEEAAARCRYNMN